MPPRRVLRFATSVHLANFLHSVFFNWWVTFKWIHPLSAYSMLWQYCFHVYFEKKYFRELWIFTIIEMRISSKFLNLVRVRQVYITIN